MRGAGMPWPGDEGEHRWEQAWMAIKRVRRQYVLKEIFKKIMLFSYLISFPMDLTLGGYSLIFLTVKSPINKVWASKWNERAYFSTRKVKLDHDYLCMAVLIQEIINADYAFVIHTTNPSTGDSSEIYTEVCLRTIDSTPLRNLHFFF